MRTRGSLALPVILIFIGGVFLVHEYAPDFSVADYIARFWPYLLILWGVIQLFEIGWKAARGAPIPVNGVSGGGWVLALVICLIGWGVWEVRRPDNWWRRAGFEQGMEVFGNEHDYPVNLMRKATGKAPHIVIESFRGNARIVGWATDEVQASAHKSIRAMEQKEADRANAATPVELVVNGDIVTIRCNQNRADSRSRVTTDLELSVPKGSTVEATGRTGDFDISGLSGDVDVTSENAGVRLADLEGNVKVDTRRGDIVRCVNVKGAIELRGHGTDVELEKIAGQVTINGDYRGTISLRDVLNPIRVQSMQTELNIQRLPGEIKIERGNVSGENMVGPLQLTTRATDVDLNGFTEGLTLNVEKGDIDLKPFNVPVGKMVVRTRSGNIDLALPDAAKFQMSASTNRGEIDNQFDDSLKSRTEGRGARLDGEIGSGPNLSLTTDHGTITVRKATGEERPTKQVTPPSGQRDKAGKKLPVGAEVDL